MKRSSYFCCAFIISCGLLTVIPTSYAKQFGKVNFPISCKKISQAKFNNALALVHHMMYNQAEARFDKILQNDPKCAMAYWGIALTQTHPLWGAEPTPAALKKGQIALNRAKSLSPYTKREADYIRALEPLYYNWQRLPYKKRLARWDRAQYALYKRYRDDADAISLYTLSHLAVAPKGDHKFRHQKRAGKLLEKMHQKHPLHPAGYHYLIHAYDNPMLAAKAEPIARGYDKIAPDVPHALHMPSHIFVRLGLWPESISWNIRSAAAAKHQPLKGGVMSMHYAHALDYLMYAYLQQGEYKKAAKIFNKLNAVKEYEDTFPTAYGVAAAQARFYLEQDLWKQAASVATDQPSSSTWNKYPATRAIIYFAQGLGAVKIAKFQQAQSIIEKLKTIEKRLRENKRDYWAVLVQSKQQTISAWLALAKGNKDKALQLMKSAAELEDSVDKHPATPGEVLPARELLGDMLIRLSKPQQALAAYQATLKISPNRLHSVFGAGFAAEQIGNVSLAKKYYEKVVVLTKNADTQLPEILHAKEYLKQHN